MAARVPDILLKIPPFSSLSGRATPLLPHFIPSQQVSLLERFKKNCSRAREGVEGETQLNLNAAIGIYHEAHEDRQKQMARSTERTYIKRFQSSF